MSPRIGGQREKSDVDETRAIVHDAAEECFSRYGLDQATIDAIVRSAGVPRATLSRAPSIPGSYRNRVRKLSPTYRSHM